MWFKGNSFPAYQSGSFPLLDFVHWMILFYKLTVWAILYFWKKKKIFIIHESYLGVNNETYPLLTKMWVSSVSSSLFSSFLYFSLNWVFFLLGVFGGAGHVATCQELPGEIPLRRPGEALKAWRQEKVRNNFPYRLHFPRPAVNEMGLFWGF